MKNEPPDEVKPPDEAKPSGKQDNKDFAKIFDGILGDYGTSVPQITVIVAVLVETFQFENYFSAGAFTFVSVLLFAFMRLFQRQVSNNVIAACKVAIPVFLVGVIFLVGFLSLQLHWGQFLKDNNKVFSAYISLILIVPIAILLISHRKQERLHGLMFPKKIQDALTNQFRNQPFYKSDIRYVVVPEVSSKGVDLDITLTYAAHNRTDCEQDWKAIFNSGPYEAKLMEARWDDVVIPLEESNLRIPDGFGFDRPIETKCSKKVCFHVKVCYGGKDAELFSTFHPGDNLVLKWKKNPELTSRHEVFCSHSHDTHPKVEGDYLVFDMSKGVLPFEGIRMNWTVKEKENHGNSPTT